MGERENTCVPTENSEEVRYSFRAQRGRRLGLGVQMKGLQRTLRLDLAHGTILFGPQVFKLELVAETRKVHIKILIWGGGAKMVA